MFTLVCEVRERHQIGWFRLPHIFVGEIEYLETERYHIENHYINVEKTIRPIKYNSTRVIKKI